MTDPAASADPRSAAQAIDALRRGWPVRIAGPDGWIDVLAIETATNVSLAQFECDYAADLLISPERADVLNITNQWAAANGYAVQIVREQRMDLSFAVALANPALDMAWPMKGPFHSHVPQQAAESAAALALARHAGLLPAFFAQPGIAADCDRTAAAPLVTTSAAAAEQFGDPAGIDLVARARLPVAAADAAEIVAFRSRDDPREHIALIVGTPDASVPVVRLHSECMTGDVLGSRKCDCGPQLAAALTAMADAPWGILLYLRQEGRGIGLINKLRAYQLQDQGFDTVDANTRLGFPVEARDFGIAARMLRLLGINAIRLMTNNPEKVARLAAAEITVVERLPLALPANPHNAAYLAAKRDRTGHQL